MLRMTRSGLYAAALVVAAVVLGGCTPPVITPPSATTTAAPAAPTYTVAPKVLSTQLRDIVPGGAVARTENVFTTFMGGEYAIQPLVTQFQALSSEQRQMGLEERALRDTIAKAETHGRVNILPGNFVTLRASTPQQYSGGSYDPKAIGLGAVENPVVYLESREQSLPTVVLVTYRAIGMTTPTQPDFGQAFDRVYNVPGGMAIQKQIVRADGNLYAVEWMARTISASCPTKPNPGCIYQYARTPKYDQTAFFGRRDALAVLNIKLLSVPGVSGKYTGGGDIKLLASGSRGQLAPIASSYNKPTVEGDTTGQFKAMETLLKLGGAAYSGTLIGSLPGFAAIG